MKRFFGLIFIASLVFGCQPNPERIDYIINGTAKDAYNGIRVYVNTYDENNRLVTIDTTMVMNGSFSFVGKVAYPKLYSIAIDGTLGRFDMMLENSEMALSIDTNILSNSVLTGSESHAVMADYSAQMTAHNEKYSRALETLKNSKFLNDENFIEKDTEDLNKIGEIISNYPYKFIQDHKNSYAVLPLIRAQLYNRNVNPEKLLAAFESIDNTIKATADGQFLEEKFNVLKIALEAEKATAIGAKAPAFAAPSTDGTSINLNDVVNKGKVTIIDFWAAWCGPCRIENPNIVSIYQKYHSKGLEIIGVGLDGRRGQQNPKEAWINAIKDDKLTWHQVSNLQYFDNIAKAYNINAIPAMFVLNAKGEIVAKNLRGKALENKIAELLD